MAKTQQQMEFDILLNQANIIQNSIKNYKIKVSKNILDLHRVMADINTETTIQMLEIEKDADNLINTIQNLEGSSTDDFSFFVNAIEEFKRQLIDVKGELSNTIAMVEVELIRNLNEIERGLNFRLPL